MKLLTYALGIFLFTQILGARDFSMQSVWENSQYNTSLDQSKIKIRSWDYSKPVPISANAAISLCMKQFLQKNVSEKKHLSEVSLDNYSTVDSPLWLWKVVIRNGKDGLIKTPGGEFKDKDRLIYFVDLSGSIYEPDKLTL